MRGCSYPDVAVIENGIKLLMARQKPNGDWEKVMRACISLYSV